MMEMRIVMRQMRKRRERGELERWVVMARRRGRRNKRARLLCIERPSS